MPIHQLSIHGSKKKRETVDDKRIDAFLEGRGDLLAALGADDALADGLRAQAHALCRSGKWQACIDVMQGLSVIGSYEPNDALVMACCLQALGRREAAAAFMAQAEQALSAMDYELRRMDQEGAAK